MNYRELIDKALHGRSVNEAAHEWGVPQTTLNTYARGKRMPDYQTALIIAREANVDPGEVMRICAEEEARKKPRGLFAELGFATATATTAAITAIIAVTTMAPSQNAEVQTQVQKGPFPPRNKNWLKLLVSKLKLAVLC